MGQDAFTQHNAIITNNKMDANYFAAAIQNNAEAELHTGKLVKALLHFATAMGIEIRTGCHVAMLDEQTKNVTVICNNTDGQQILFTAQQVVCCTNAFTKQLIPTIDITPGRGQVLITKPIKNLAIKGIYHMQEGYYYCREINGRVLFGGGRHLDKATEATTTFASNALIMDSLVQLLQNHLLPTTPFEIDYTWSGIMAFGNTNKNPIIAKHTDKVFLAVRCGGMGVAIGSQLAQQVVQLLIANQ
jgi:gamma-glutamylputrescine oxidase